jgi:hypothetical protein
LKAEFCKGSKRELVARLINTASEERAAHIRDLHNNPRYVIYDLETDTHTLTHRPNHCEVEILKTHHTHDYEKSIVGRKTFEGYGCEPAFCEWLFQEENGNSTVIAHNGAGYDNKFILQYCLFTLLDIHPIILLDCHHEGRLFRGCLWTMCDKL